MEAESIQIMITSKHMDIPEDLKSYAQEKMSKLPRYYDRIQQVEVVFDDRDGGSMVEAVAIADHGNTFVAHHSSSDLFGAVDAVHDKLTRQLHRHKDKYRNRKHPEAGPGEGAIGSPTS
jgi:putative sigma-54 modulation protein